MDTTVYLAQTDTTVGFLSKNKEKLNSIKNRPPSTPCLKSVASCKELLLHVRVPNKFKRVVRYSKNSTFIYPNKEAVRVVKNSKHKNFLILHGWLYSTSANISGQKFDEEFARSVVDSIVEDERGFFEAKASDIIRLGKEKKRRIRG